MKKVRVRYAPSPTGHLHIGGARTALFNYLYAKHHGGDFVFRLEDTDIERNIEGGEASQLDNLAWLGIIPDESPLNPKPEYAPYRQMERLDIYNKYINILLEKGYAYKCFCTPEELEAEHEKQTAAGLAPKYNRKCCNLTAEEIKEKEEAELPYTIRVKVPANETYEFDVPVRDKSDAFNRTMVRFDEMYQSLRIIYQCLDRLDANGDRQMRLPDARAAHEQDVLRQIHEPKGREFLDLGPRDAGLERPVEVGERLDVGEARRAHPLAHYPLAPGRHLRLRHLGHGLREVALSVAYHAHVVGHGRAHLVELELG